MNNEMNNDSIELNSSKNLPVKNRHLIFSCPLKLKHITRSSQHFIFHRDYSLIIITVHEVHGKVAVQVGPEQTYTHGNTQE